MDKLKKNNIDYKDDIVKLLGEWVNIPSIYDESTKSITKPFGEGINKALKWFETLGKNNGFKVGNVDNHAVYIEYGSGDECIDIFGHCDVVDVCDGWQYDPFSLTINKDKLIGRGVSDNKGPMIACFLALKSIKDKGVKLNRKVRLIVGGDEETGFRCIRQYYKKEKYGVFGFTPDGKFPVLNGEKGAGIIDLHFKIEDVKIKVNGGSIHNTIPNNITISGLEKMDNIIINGKGGHSSKPEKAVNPIPKTFLYLYKTYNMHWANYMYKIFNESNIDGNIFGINKVGKCGSLSIVPTIISIEEGRVRLTISVRFPENIKFNEIIEGIQNYFNKTDKKINIIGKEIKKANYIDEESLLVKKLHEIYMKYTKDISNKIRVTNAGSYASEMRNAVIFGCEFLDGSSGNVHMCNEYASLEKLNLAICIYKEAMITLCNDI